MRSPGPTRPRTLVPRAPVLALLLAAVTMAPARAQEHDETDPTRNTPLPCELAGLPGLPPRSAENLIHLANRCGVVGTDVELQSRKDANGNVHDYAFLGTMGYGFRIFDVTDPANPVGVGGFNDTGWQNDVQVRGNIVVSTFDGVAGEPSTGSTCLKLNFPTAGDQGVDIFRLRFDPVKAVSKALDTFAVSNPTCIANPPGGAHNATLHPSGAWLAISNPSSDWAVDVIDLRRLGTTGPVHRFRLIDESRRNTSSTFPPGPRCPTGATFKCIVMKRPPAPALGSNTSFPPCNPSCTSSSSAWGLWRPHDLHFSRDGNTMYVAALNSTFIVNVTNLNKVFKGLLSTVSNVPTLSIIPNISQPPPPGSDEPLDNPENIELSHQADVSSDGKVLVISDERGGGLEETRCNTDEAGVIGGLHFWALADIGVPASANATPRRPKRLGSYFNPNPGLGADPLQVQIEALPRAERACTAHVFRLGGNGTTSPGPAHPAFNGVSTLASRLMVLGWYGAGVWRVNFRGPSRSNDGIAEEPRSTWGNTQGWNVQAGAETWSAKEYKGFIYAGDMLRGFDVYACAYRRNGIQQPVACPADPVVALSKSGPASAARGSTVDYTITYRNAGPAASWAARITDQLPAELRFVSAAKGGVYDPGTQRIVWELGTVEAGAAGSVSFRARVSSGAPVGTAVVNRADFTGELTVSPPTAVATTIVEP